MGLFGKTDQEKPELSEKGSEEIILKHINKIANDENGFRLIRLLMQIMDENQNISLICSFRKLSRFRKDLTCGFYQILSIVDRPFYPGDILVFSHDKEYKKGDTLQYCDLRNEGKLEFHYLIFDFIKEDGVVVRTVLKDDDKKYTIQPWQILGRLVFKYDPGSAEWKKFIESEGIDKDKIIDDIERDIKSITDTQEFPEKEEVLSELKRRKGIITNPK